MIEVKVEATGLLDPKILQAWTRERQRKIHNAVARGLKIGGNQIAENIRQVVASTLSIRKKALLKSIKAKVFSEKESELPSVLIGSKLRILAIHQEGGEISPKRGKFLFIPLPGQKRPGKKKLSGTYGKTFILPNRRGEFTVFKYKGRGGALSQPVGILKRSVILQPRYSIPNIVNARRSMLISAIEDHLKQI
jgi:hypothetical protein